MEVRSTPRSGLPSAVASPDPGKGGAYGTVGARVGCSGPSKKCSAGASSDAGGWEGEICVGMGVASGSCIVKDIEGDS